MLFKQAEPLLKARALTTQLTLRAAAALSGEMGNSSAEFHDIGSSKRNAGHSADAQMGVDGAQDCKQEHDCECET